ncbi:M48 family metalloprotease [Hydrogenophaga sp. 5NK40-0174]|uniref:M48 family metalloprotease n=1 Tax=Hydrogenophaga sp. 5NK40-0174 TaxID=3127649 RepID=UPI003105BF7E
MTNTKPSVMAVDVPRTNAGEFGRLAEELRHNRVSRRSSLWLLGAASAAPALAVLQGCAQSPVSGESILVGMSEEQERAIDAKVSPHQFSQDLGAVQDAPSNDYVQQVGRQMQGLTHRPDMPYSYRVLNANHVNAYTFPGGAMGVTRGILVELKDEAELAALLGHEMGHVNARHAAQRQGSAMVTQVAVAGLNVAASGSKWSGLVGLGSQVGASALLASYSRDNEREADALGQSYMVKAGYPANGMTELHQLLVDQEKQEPGMLATMFSSHPMSRERRDAAAVAAKTSYAASLGASPQRERFMDSTSSLRAQRSVIKLCQEGESAMAREALPQAHTALQSAMKSGPRDYAAHVRMAQCLQAMGQPGQARSVARQAQALYPQEAQAHKLAGVLALQMKDPGNAFASLDQFDRLLPGNAGVLFLKGVSLEGMGEKEKAAQHYASYLEGNREGKAAQYAVSRLRAWGYVR